MNQQTMDDSKDERGDMSRPCHGIERTCPPTRLSEFDYALPKGFIAQYPASSRELARMLVLNRNTGDVLHKRFTDFSSYIKKDDILVLNDTKVVNARLIGKRTTGGKAEVFLVEKLGENRFKALIKPSARIKEGSEIVFNRSRLKARVCACFPSPPGRRRPGAGLYLQSGVGSGAPGPGRDQDDS